MNAPDEPVTTPEPSEPEVPAPETPAPDPSEADALRAELSRGHEAHQATLNRLREALIASEPAVAPELVHGETLEEVEASFAAACEVVARVRESVAREQAATVPAGAPGRSRPSPRSAFEKIRDGLGRA